MFNFCRANTQMAGSFNNMQDKLLICFLFLFALSASVQAQIYKCENEAEEINFSDEPCSKGEKGERLKWLKETSSKKKRGSSKYKPATQAEKTAEKAKKDNQAYVLLSLLTTTQLELESASLRSSLNGKTTEKPELLLPDGMTIDLLQVDKIILSYKGKTKGIKAHFFMRDGYEEVKMIKKSFPVISGDARIGHFSKSLKDIKKIEFFNSKILVKNKKYNKSLANNQSSVSSSPSASNSTIKKSSRKNETPVIELDLSHQLPGYSSETKTNKTPQIKVVDKKTNLKGIQVDFVNQKKMTLNKETLSSIKGTQASKGQHFIISAKNQIPYEKIKSIKIRPTSSKQLIVAVELKTKEIKMEVMSPPFTRIVGQSQLGAFDHSLQDIKSISFQR